MSNTECYILLQADCDISQTNLEHSVSFSVIASDCANEKCQSAAIEVVTEKEKLLAGPGFRTALKVIDFETPVKCLFFLKVIPSFDSGKTLIVCFTTAEITNELFIEDMRWLAERLESLTPYNLENVKETMSVWLPVASSFVSVCLKAMGDDCDKLIFASLRGMNVVFSVEFDTDDTVRNMTMRLCFERFVSACRLSELGVGENASSGDIVLTQNEGKVSATFRQHDERTATAVPVTSFCREWCSALIQNAGQSSASNSTCSVDIRKLLENYRLRVLQDLNFCNRLLKTAEADYYGFYRLYLFVRSHANAAVLLDHLYRSQMIYSADLSSVVTALSSAIKFNS